MSWRIIKLRDRSLNVEPLRREVCVRCVERESKREAGEVLHLAVTDSRDSVELCGYGV
jgi:hypothetical protein